MGRPCCGSKAGPGHAPSDSTTRGPAVVLVQATHCGSTRPGLGLGIGAGEGAAGSGLGARAGLGAAGSGLGAGAGLGVLGSGLGAGAGLGLAGSGLGAGAGEEPARGVEACSLSEAGGAAAGGCSLTDSRRLQQVSLHAAVAARERAEACRHGTLCMLCRAMLRCAASPGQRGSPGRLKDGTPHALFIT